MADTLIIDWLNENALRSYPLKERITRTSSGVYTLTNDLILDAQFTYFSEEIPSEVKLLNITSTLTDVSFTITALETFTVAKDAGFPAYLRTSQGQLLVIGESAANIPVGVYNFTNVVFEPSVSTEFLGEWEGVSSIRFAALTALDGTIDFTPGFQFDINITGQNIALSCGAGKGRPLSCNSFGDYTNDCDEILSYINGVAPDGNGVMHLFSGGGILILEDPDNHRIFVGLTNDPTTDICNPITSNPAV